MEPKDTNNVILEDPDAHLARVFLEEYFRDKDYTFKDVCRLPEEEARRIMIEACTYASVKLAEIRDKAELIRELHGVTERI